MAAAPAPGAAPAARPRLPVWPAGADRLVLAVLGLGLAVMYGPAYNELAHTIWATDEQGHGPIILALSLWLIYTKRHAVAAAALAPRPLLAWPLLVFSLALYAFGRSQDIIIFAIGSQITLLVALGLMLVLDKVLGFFFSNAKAPA